MPLNKLNKPNQILALNKDFNFFKIILIKNIKIIFEGNYFLLEKYSLYLIIFREMMLELSSPVSLNTEDIFKLILLT